MKLDWSAQQLLIIALRTQIEVWKSLSKADELREKEEAGEELSEEEEEEEMHLQNDIGHAYAVLSDMESSFYKEFGDTIL